MVLNVLAGDRQRFEQLAGHGAAAQIAAMTAQWTIESDAPGPLVRARIYADEQAITAVLQRAVMPKMTAVVPDLDIGTCYRQALAGRRASRHVC